MQKLTHTLNTPPPPTASSVPRRGIAFTLTEILTVIAIISLLLGIAFPTIKLVISSVSNGSAIKTISIGVTSARAYSTQTLTSTISGATFSGAAALFTPNHEIRIVRNAQAAFYKTTTSSTLLDPIGLNGYEDIPDRDYIKIPQYVGIIGIARNTTTAPLLLTPPFAIRFNEHGQLIAGIQPNSDRVVYYDSNYDANATTITRGWNITATTTFSDGSDRRNPYGTWNYLTQPYNPDAWNSYHDSFDTAHYNSSESKLMLPFENIETVIAILVYPRQEFDNQGLTLDAAASNTSGDLNAAAKTWLLQVDATTGELSNATSLFFSRYTGSRLRKTQ